MVVGDFNGDGIPDIATPVGVELGDGDGTFRGPADGFGIAPLNGSNGSYMAMVEGDFFGDGHLDLVFATNPYVGWIQNTITLLLGNGDGTFQPPETITAGNFPSGDFPAALAIGDFNKDGKLDLAVAFEGNSWEGGTDPGGVSIVLGNGDGTFQPPKDYAAGNIFSPADLVAGYFNGGGSLDLAVTNYNDGTISVLLGNGDGTFQAPRSLATGGGPYGIAMGDFNGDGRADLAVTDAYDKTVSILLSNGDGTFQTPKIYAAGNSPNSVVAGDFNGDGKLDLAVASAYSNSFITILFGNGDGTFQSPLQTAGISDSNYPSLVAGDFNGGGRLDLAETSQSTSAR